MNECRQRSSEAHRIGRKKDAPFIPSQVVSHSQYKQIGSENFFTISMDNKDKSK